MDSAGWDVRDVIRGSAAVTAMGCRQDLKLSDCNVVCRKLGKWAETFFFLHVVGLIYVLHLKDSNICFIFDSCSQIVSFQYYYGKWIQGNIHCVCVVLPSLFWNECKRLKINTIIKSK